jgi:hypothetical protein
MIRVGADSLMNIDPGVKHEDGSRRTCSMKREAPAAMERCFAQKVAANEKKRPERVLLFRVVHVLVDSITVLRRTIHEPHEKHTKSDSVQAFRLLHVSAKCGSHPPVELFKSLQLSVSAVS